MNAERVPPAFAATQRSDILRLLREAKDRGQGVRKSDLVFEYRYTQAAARIWELERQGYVIRHETEPGQRLVTYFLEREPEDARAPGPAATSELAPEPDSKDRPRKTGLPLFDLGAA